MLIEVKTSRSEFRPSQKEALRALEGLHIGYTAQEGLELRFQNLQENLRVVCGSHRRACVSR